MNIDVSYTDFFLSDTVLQGKNQPEFVADYEAARTG
jgi:hypothetical protein